MNETFIVINDTTGETAKFVLCVECSVLIPDPMTNSQGFNHHQDWHRENGG